jgi:hypothetical protein
MARFITIDNNSGFIFGDTAAELVSRQSDWTAKGEADIIEAVRLLDESTGESGRQYVYHHADPRSTVTGYHVYDASGDQVACVLDGQDRETIDAVESSCDYVGFVEVVA